MYEYINLQDLLISKETIKSASKLDRKFFIGELWLRKANEHIAPVNLIPLAAKTKEIISIGNGFLPKARQRNKQWKDDDFPSAVISVILSLRRLSP